ncbi:C-C motif chemokine 19 precursor [Esox lucius]|uniref:C-C motif chemokine 19 n=1 Tax=Esox lucius TaxID=8010 RepID=C1BXR8_ESOLU|nr:C-C motif chemokine 19b precursor [Esox lucius]ACO13821.1 C-C motif chemokine 19 precursor [Esox lucius]
MYLRVATLLLLASVLWSHVAANTGKALDCCLTTTDARIPSRMAKTYIIQTSNGGCRIPATVFITKKNRRLCAPPATKKKWVAKLIKQLKTKLQKGKARKGKNGKRQHSVAAT